MPYQVQKSRLIEKIAELLIARRLPLLDDVRDESAEDVRLVLVPKSRTVDPNLLMESLFRLSDLENRIPLNLNVLSMGKVPKVMNLAEVLSEWLAHRREVLQRRSRHPPGGHRTALELLSGFLIAYLNLDEVIRIIREEDEPKLELMKTFELTDVQAEAILNMRLRSLRKLEELEIRKEFDG
jgi:topoisomerase-4 subunit A